MLECRNDIPVTGNPRHFMLPVIDRSAGRATNHSASLSQASGHHKEAADSGDVVTGEQGFSDTHAPVYAIPYIDVACLISSESSYVHDSLRSTSLPSNNQCGLMTNGGKEMWAGATA